MIASNQALENSVDETKQADVPTTLAAPAIMTPPSAESSSERMRQPATAEELKAYEREARPYFRERNKRLKAREAAIKQGDVAATLQNILDDLLVPTDKDLIGSAVTGDVGRALNAAYDHGGALQMAEAALKPGLLVLGQAIACCAALIKRNGIFEISNHQDNQQVVAASNCLSTLETACASLVKLAKGLATAKHAAQLAAAQTDGDSTPWKQTRNNRLNGKRYPRTA